MDKKDILKYAKISKQSYSDQQPDKFLKFNNVKLIEIKETTVLILYNEKEICFSFRGTNDYADVKLNINFLKTKFKSFSNEQTIKYIHYGFLQYYNNVKKELFEILDDYILKFPGSLITFTGHSLGSTVILFAIDVFYSRPNLKDLINVVIFGSPKIGNSTFIGQCNQINNLLRITHPEDLVPHVPPSFLNYSHTHNVLQLIPYKKYQLFNNIMKSTKNSFNCNIFRMIKNNILKPHSIDEYIKTLKFLSLPEDIKQKNI